MTNQIGDLINALDLHIQEKGKEELDSAAFLLQTARLMIKKSRRKLMIVSATFGEIDFDQIDQQLSRIILLIETKEQEF